MKNEKYTIKNKTNKIMKRPGTMYCLGCKDLTNKVFRKKSNCMVCWSNKSRFLKQKRNNKR